jgi:ATP-dependent RNA helicase RhlE
VYLVERRDKVALLEYLLSDKSITRTLVFTRTKRAAENLAMDLKRSGVRADAIHSDKSQPARRRALEDFRKGTVRVLVASDIASRGIDIDEISHVINFDLPESGEAYVHRTGRTGRAGQTGIALSFCTIDERAQLDDIEKLLRQRIETAADNPFASPLGRRNKDEVKKPQSRNGRIMRRGRRR